jgi:YD repeat-containing protein
MMMLTALLRALMETKRTHKNGNRLALSSVTNNSTDTVDYTYDELNRLIELKKNGSVAGVYKYNGDGLLVEKTQDGVKTRYYYDGSEIIAEGTVASDGAVSLIARPILTRK